MSIIRYILRSIIRGMIYFFLFRFLNDAFPPKTRRMGQPKEDMAQLTLMMAIAIIMYGYLIHLLLKP